MHKSIKYNPCYRCYRCYRFFYYRSGVRAHTHTCLRLIRNVSNIGNIGNTMP